MEQPLIEDIILRYSHRGMDLLRPYLPPFFCREAAESILSWERGTVILTTGFYVAGHAETDGPPGTMVLAKALEILGFSPVILTDLACDRFFEPEGLDVIYMPFGKDDGFARRTLNSLHPVGMISVERCGHDESGDYINSRGESVERHTAHTDALFEEAYGTIPTIGIGDGGNEIGMGNLAEIIEEKLDIGVCRVKTDHLVIASVSNWGAYGIAAYLQQLSGIRLFPELAFVEGYLERTVALGSVDGVIRRNICGVDGYPMAVSEEIYGALYEQAQRQLYKPRTP